MRKPVRSVDGRVRSDVEEQKFASAREQDLEGWSCAVRRRQLRHERAHEGVELPEMPEGLAGNGARESGIAPGERRKTIESRLKRPLLVQDDCKQVLCRDARGQPRRVAQWRAPQGPSCVAGPPAIARNRAIRSAVEGWLANSPEKFP